MKIKVKKVNAFTDSLYAGNPAGVVLDAPSLSDEQMAYISKTLKVSETAFVYPSKKADFKVRFFTPSIEVELCGHATIATFYVLALKNKLFKEDITQETKAGVLPLKFYYDPFKNFKRVMMTQANLQIKDIYLDISDIADSLNIPTGEINTKVPIKAVSTGLFTLPVCIKKYDTLKEMKPNFKKIKEICKKNGFGSYHVFTFETLENDSVFHARNFAPFYSINEDPVTGTANGAVCSFLLKNNIIKGNNFVCEQGDIIGKAGRVFVEINKDVVMVGGIAKIVEEKEIEL